MKKYGFLFLLYLVLNLPSGKAQAPLPPYEFSVAPGTTLANCAVVPNQTTWCWTSDGNTYKSINGAPFVNAIPVLTAVTRVNGVAPGATGNITLSCTAPAPAITVTGTVAGPTTTLVQLDTPTVVASGTTVTCVTAGN